MLNHILKINYHWDGVNGKNVRLSSEQVHSKIVMSDFVYLSLTIEVII